MYFNNVLNFHLLLVYVLCLLVLVDCFCDKECGLRNDCCFPDKDEYNLNDDESLSCISATTYKSEDIDASPSYYMVDTCPTVRLYSC